jgi:orc1/cdc6 family replication initiation protein
MIQDARVLQDDFIPREVVHRHDEMNQLAAALEPVVEGDIPQNALLVGPSGAGKTCIARYSLDKLEEQLLDVQTHYVDCWQHSKPFRALLKILEGVRSTYDIHRSTPYDEMLARLEDIETPYIVVLDEVDQLEEKDLLKELYAIPEVTMVMIANRERDVYDALDERLQSRLRGSVTIQFDAYSDDQLVSILEDRVEWGLTPGAADTETLEFIADAAGGNARDAINILQSAARKAERESAGEITTGHLEFAIPDARERIRQKSLDRLNGPQRAIYDVLAELGEVSPKELYHAYTDCVEDPRSERTVRRYLTKLEDYNLAESYGRGPDRTYEPILE